MSPASEKHPATNAHAEMVDVVVIGGGPTGIGAALGAARTGARVAVVERHPVLGGMGTAGLVNIFANAHFDGERLIIGGVFAELRQRLIERGLLFPTDSAYRGEPFCPDGLNEEAAAACREAGIAMHLGHGEPSIAMEGEALRLAFPEGRRLTARSVVDATGDAAVAHALGAGSTFGRTDDHQVMPLSYCFLAGPVDIDALRAECPQGIRHDHHSGEDYIYCGGAPLVTERIHQAQREGTWTIPRDNGAVFSVPGRPEICSFNITRVFCRDPTDPRLLAAADREGRAQVEACLAFFRARIPGFAEAKLVEMARQIGVRESRQIIGGYTLTLQDAIACRQFEDVVAQCCYGVDDHRPGKDTPGADTWSLDHVFRPGEHYDIPLRCLIPAAGPANVIVAGRSISAERKAMASFRQQSCCMALGQAAGVTAALAAAQGRAMRDVAYPEVREVLLRQGAILE